MFAMILFASREMDKRGTRFADWTSAFIPVEWLD
jgi:hypothetical protein